MPKKEIKKKTNQSGRRKTSIARVFIRKGKGEIKINKKDYKEYFRSIFVSSKINEPFILLNCEDEYDVTATVKGGGYNSQAEAVRLGISKCLAKTDSKYKSTLRNAGMLTRDSRVVESKKAGRKKARKSNQFSKR